MKKVVLIAVVLAALMLAVPVWSQGGHGPGGPRASSAVMAVLPPPADMIDPLTQMLSLTTDQVTSLTTVLTDSDSTIQPLLQTATDADKALHDALIATDYDPNAVAELAQKAQAAEGDVIAASLDVWTQIRDILTADQIAILQAGPSGPPPANPGSSSSSGNSYSR